MFSSSCNLPSSIYDPSALCSVATVRTTTTTYSQDDDYLNEGHFVSPNTRLRLISVCEKYEWQQLRAKVRRYQNVTLFCFIPHHLSLSYHLSTRRCSV
jgi:hypothetical protein